MHTLPSSQEIGVFSSLTHSAGQGSPDTRSCRSTHPSCLGCCWGRKGVTSPFFLDILLHQSKTVCPKNKTKNQNKTPPPKKRAMIPLGRAPGDIANQPPRAEGNLHPSTLPLPNKDTTERLPHWWAWKNVGRAVGCRRGLLPHLGELGRRERGGGSTRNEQGGLQGKAGPGTRYQRVSGREWEQICTR